MGQYHELHGRSHSPKHEGIKSRFDYAICHARARAVKERNSYQVAALIRQERGNEIRSPREGPTRIMEIASAAPVCAVHIKQERRNTHTRLKA